VVAETEDIDPVTQDMVIDILDDEASSVVRGFLRGYEH
jgi:hypothetical protein